MGYESHVRVKSLLKNLIIVVADLERQKRVFRQKKSPTRKTHPLDPHLNDWFSFKNYYFQLLQLQNGLSFFEGMEFFDKKECILLGKF